MRTGYWLIVIALLVSATVVGADDNRIGMPTTFVFGVYDKNLASADAPDCTFDGCNNYIGLGCTPFSSWLIGGLTPSTALHIQAGCSRVTYGQIGGVNYCLCHCATGGVLPSPCTTERMAAPATSLQDGPDGFPSR